MVWEKHILWKNCTFNTHALLLVHARTDASRLSTQMYVRSHPHLGTGSKSL